MNEDVNVVFGLLMLFVFLAMMRSRGLSRRQRELQQTIAHLQTAQAAAPAALPGASKEQVERLESRVRVLERIVTDKGFNLAAEIEALRDQRSLADLPKLRETEGSN